MQVITGLARVTIFTLCAITSLACDKLKLNCAVDDVVDWRLSLARFWESNFNKRAVGKYESARSRPPLQASPKYICTSLLTTSSAA